MSINIGLEQSGNSEFIRNYRKSMAKHLLANVVFKIKISFEFADECQRERPGSSAFVLTVYLLYCNTTNAQLNESFTIF